MPGPPASPLLPLLLPRVRRRPKGCQSRPGEAEARGFPVLVGERALAGLCCAGCRVNRPSEVAAPCNSVDAHLHSHHRHRRRQVWPLLLMLPPVVLPLPQLLRRPTQVAAAGAAVAAVGAAAAAPALLCTYRRRQRHLHTAEIGRGRGRAFVRRKSSSCRLCCCRCCTLRAAALDTTHCLLGCQPLHSSPARRDHPHHPLVALQPLLPQLREVWRAKGRLQV
jgi:hypothetical protein